MVLKTLQNKGFDYVSLGRDFYDYEPFQDSRVDYKGESREIDLGIDWDLVFEKVTGPQGEYCLVLFGNSTNVKPKSRMICNNNYTIEFPEQILKIPSKIGNLDLVLSKTIFSSDMLENDGREEEQMTIDLLTPWKNGGKEHIGTISLSRCGDDWNLKHRVVRPKYRGQRLGTLMHKLLESSLKCLADETGRDQILGANVGQLNVLNWFLKNGYELEDCDKEKFEKILEGDQTYIIKSAEKDRQADCPRQWYIFEREVYEKFGNLIWRMDNGKGHLRFSTRFNLSKRVETDFSEVIRQRSETANSLASALVLS